MAAVDATLPGRRRRRFGVVPLSWLYGAAWFGLWLSIGVGSWNITNPGPGLSGLIGLIRALYIPFIFILLLMLFLFALPRLKVNAIEFCFLLYGGFGLLAALLFEQNLFQIFFGAAFCAVVVLALLVRQSCDPVSAQKMLNSVSWFMGSAVLFGMLLVARDALFAADVQSGYGVVTRVQESKNITVSRSSGMSRLAAIPAIISLIVLASAHRFRWRIVAGITLLGSAYIIWFMQSRGALVGFTATLLFAAIYGRRATNIIVIIGLLIAGGAVALTILDLSGVWDHFTRSEGAAGFRTMSGRPIIWSKSIGYILDEPLLGYGFQADRLFLTIHGGNAQSAYIYAGLTAGLPGALAFTYASVRAFISALYVGRNFDRLGYEDKIFAKISAAILFFSLVRSLPENQAAVFSIDLLVQYPAMLLLFLYERQIRRGG